MTLDELYPSKWLKAADVMARPILATIEGYEIVELEEGENKPVLHLKDSKSLVLNRTNAATIASFLGNDIDLWKGHQIVLFTMKVNFQGRFVDSIRVREPKRQAPAAAPRPAPRPPQPTAPPAEKDASFENSDVPF